MECANSDTRTHKCDYQVVLGAYAKPSWTHASALCLRFRQVQTLREFIRR
jgi:hypothetical protein